MFLVPGHVIQNHQSRLRSVIKNDRDLSPTKLNIYGRTQIVNLRILQLRLVAPYRYVSLMSVCHFVSSCVISTGA